MFCRSLFVLLSFILWSLITPLVTLNSSYVWGDNDLSFINIHTKYVFELFANTIHDEVNTPGINTKSEQCNTTD